MTSSLVFLLYPKESVIRAIYAVAHHQPFKRPQIWTLALIEWIVVVCVWAWITVGTLHLWRHPRPADSLGPR